MTRSLDDADSLQLYNGNHPWSQFHYIDVGNKVRRGEHPPRPGRSDFTDCHWNICLSCWRRHPNDRPMMTSIREEIARIRIGE